MDPYVWGARYIGADHEKSGAFAPARKKRTACPFGGEKDLLFAPPTRMNEKIPYAPPPPGENLLLHRWSGNHPPQRRRPKKKHEQLQK